MVGSGVDGVWGTGGMSFKGELAVVPCTFSSSLHSLSCLVISSNIMYLLLKPSLVSCTSFLSKSKVC
jgi:hypothetical protein